MSRFYQTSYAQKGLTTELPSISDLQVLKNANFADTNKDLSRLIYLLKHLGIGEGQRVLDFGCSWGYGLWQLAQHGYKAVGFEISVPRATFGREHLGVEIYSTLNDIRGDFDVVYSSHVLEHVPNPWAALEEMSKRLRPDGFIIAFTPNGSTESQRHSPVQFSDHWGLVHPVLLTADFPIRTGLFKQVFATSRDQICGEDIVSDLVSDNHDLRFGELLIIATNNEQSIQKIGQPFN